MLSNGMPHLHSLKGAYKAHVVFAELEYYWEFFLGPYQVLG